LQYSIEFVSKHCFARALLFDLIPVIDKSVTCPKVNVYVAPVPAGTKAKQAQMTGRESKGGRAAAVEMASRACRCVIL